MSLNVSGLTFSDVSNNYVENEQTAESLLYHFVISSQSGKLGRDSDDEHYTKYTLAFQSPTIYHHVMENVGRSWCNRAIKELDTALEKAEVTIKVTPHQLLSEATSAASLC